MQATVVNHWLAIRGVLLHGPDYFPELPAAGVMRAQMVRSSIQDGAESVHIMYLLSIAAARRSLLLSSSYFVPDKLAMDALVGGATSGCGRPDHRAGPEH